MKKVLSILLSFIIVASHMYLTIGTHFCGGEAVETKIMFGKSHLGCGMMEMTKHCDAPENYNENQTTVGKVPCCKNEYETIQSVDNFLKNATQTVEKIDFVVAFIYVTLNVDLFSRESQHFFVDYHAPPLEKDAQVLFQTFLL
ncbi:hypothetical protein C7377_0232 [Balneicella halophila]|uniref:Uncharacterized protein n=1 Tax=Balneicella halophila TaxID=1537566 RepID=A0A7L4UQ79_BALHA|nr:hypothetical protein [Balneicella halophila]PVX51938.1 hypothetical protein C7377_0232 [Balneicella halophila]